VDSKYILSYKIRIFLLYSPGTALQHPTVGSHSIYLIVVKGAVMSAENCII